MSVFVGFVFCLALFAFLIVAGLFFADTFEGNIKKMKGKYIYDKYLGRYRK